MRNERVLPVLMLWFVYGCWASNTERWKYFMEDSSDTFDHHHHHHEHDISSTRSAVQEIPLELLKELSNVSSLNDFINNYLDQKSIKNATQPAQQDLLSNRFGADERKSVQSPKPAACIPEPKVVSLRIYEDPALFYYPFCTRIERCGGCCGSALLSCQPSQTEMVNFEVLVTEYKGGRQMQFKEKAVIPVERHTQCKCDCIVKDTDCNQFQEYRKNECRCVCLNVDEQQKCLAENETKIWDPMSCTCQCRDTRECTTGLYFDQNTCRCEQVPKVRSRSPLQIQQLQRRSKIGATP